MRAISLYSAWRLILVNPRLVPASPGWSLFESTLATTADETRRAADDRAGLTERLAALRHREIALSTDSAHRAGAAGLSRETRQVHAFADAATVLHDEQAITVRDDEGDEERYVTIGMGALGNVLVVV